MTSVVDAEATVSFNTLRTFGVADPAYLASGMEGHLFRVGDQTVAKVWHHFAKSQADLTALQSFYETLQSLQLPFATPEIFSVHAVADTTISFERELPGRPMNHLIDEADDQAPPFAVDALTLILTQLAERRDEGRTAPLPLLGVPVAETSGSEGPTDALLRVARVKVARFGAQLRAAVPDFDWMYARTVEHLRNLPPLATLATCPVHGDICAENILLDESRRVSAVLDWGFLSLFGDPALDASLAAGFFNMYGPHHRAIDDHLLDTFARTFGYTRERMLLYRALYAMVTSNAYSDDGRDGHFAWCVEQLARQDVRAALAASYVE